MLQGLKPGGFERYGSNCIEQNLLVSRSGVELTTSVPRPPPRWETARR
jgi:hypothetical protein